MLTSLQSFRSLSTTAPSQDAQSKVNDWKLGKLNHVAIAVPDLEKASQLYQDVLGADVSDVVVSFNSHYTIGVNPTKQVCGTHSPQKRDFMIKIGTA